MALLEIEDLRVEFHTGKHTVYALRGVNMQIERGSRTAIVGESGSGKTITAMTVLRLLPTTARITSGRILFQGKELLALPESEFREIRGSQVCIIFQNATAALNPLYPVGSQIADIYRHHAKISKREAWEKAVEALAATGIPDPAKRARNFPFEYSGGMAQRAMIAMALACAPQLLIADEPTSDLDVTIQVQVLDLILEVVERLHSTLVLVSHDIGLVSAVCDQVVVMYAGTVMEAGAAEQVLLSPANPYTSRLLECFGKIESDTMPFIPGRVPDLREQWSGCSFVARCPLAQDICRRQAPALVEIEPGHLSACHFV